MTAPTELAAAPGPAVPLACHLDSANKSEVKLLERTLDGVAVKARRDGVVPKPRLLILDRGYDSDPLRGRLASRGIEMVCPHRRNRRRPQPPRRRPAGGRAGRRRGTDPAPGGPALSPVLDDLTAVV